METKLRKAILVALGSTLCIMGCSGHGTPPELEKTLNIYNWSASIAPDTVANFERETGIHVRYDVFDSDEVLEARLLAGHTNYDIVVPSDVFFDHELRAGVFLKLDPAALPNRVNLDPEIMHQLATHDPGNLHGIPVIWTTTGIVYNPDKVRARLGSAEFDSWSLVFDSTLAAKLQDCGIVLLDSPTEVLSSMLLYQGRDPNSRDPAVLSAAADALMRIRPFVRSITSVGNIDALADGSVCLALGWSGVMTQAQDRAREAANGQTLRYIVPKEGGLLSIDTMGIPADAPHPQNAERWLNYLMRPDVIAAITNQMKFPNANLASQSLLLDSIKHDPTIYPDAPTRARLHALTTMDPETSRLVTRLWTRFRNGH